jgi:hypothetical protein
MTKRLTRREIEAIVEALHARLAGAIETEIDRKHYESAVDKMSARLERTTS